MLYEAVLLLLNGTYCQAFSCLTPFPWCPTTTAGGYLPPHVVLEQECSKWPGAEARHPPVQQPSRTAYFIHSNPISSHLQNRFNIYSSPTHPQLRFLRFPLSPANLKIVGGKIPKMNDSWSLDGVLFRAVRWALSLWHVVPPGGQPSFCPGFPHHVSPSHQSLSSCLGSLSACTQVTPVLPNAVPRVQGQWCWPFTYATGKPQSASLEWKCEDRTMREFERQKPSLWIKLCHTSYVQKIIVCAVQWYLDFQASAAGLGTCPHGWGATVFPKHVLVAEYRGHTLFLPWLRHVSAALWKGKLLNVTDFFMKTNWIGLGLCSFVTCSISKCFANWNGFALNLVYTSGPVTPSRWGWLSGRTAPHVIDAAVILSLGSLLLDHCCLN